MSNVVKLSILMRDPWQTPEGLLQVQAIAPSLGITIATIGHASLTGRIPLNQFEQIFGVTPTTVEPALPSGQDFGASGGYISEVELPIPASLIEYVESIEIPPPAYRF